MVKTHTSPSAAEENDAARIREVTSLLAGDMQRLGEAFKALAGDSWDTVQHKLLQLYAEGKGKYADAESRCVAHIKAKPLESVMIAASIGFLVGWIKKSLK